MLAGADDARIGDVCDGCGNLLAGNSNEGRTGHGVLVGGDGTLGQRIVNNRIGLNIDGGALPNDDGILIVDGGHATVGERGVSGCNVISGNRVAGIEVRDTSFLQIRIEANLIGLDPTGTRSVPNDVGVFFNEGAGNIALGAPFASAANVIAGNRVGVAVETRARDITIQANRIGLDLFGLLALPNTEDGISIVAGARDVLIGGPGADDGNHIAGNGNAIVIEGAATANVTIQGNVLGLARIGAAPLANGSGISVSEATGIRIGGRADGEGNTIVASTGPAIVLRGTAGAEVFGNRIGLGPLDQPIGNGVGVVVENGASDNRIQENLFAANREAGIQVIGADAVRNRLTRNAFLDAPGPPIALDAAVAALGSRVQAVFRFDAAAQRWEVFRPAFDFLADLESLARGDAIWVQVDQGDRLFWAQPPALTSARSVALEAGLNFVSWTGPPTAVREALGPVADVTQAVFRYDRATRTFALIFPALLPGFDPQLQPHNILWLRLDEPADWNQPPR